MKLKYKIQDKLHQAYKALEIKEHRLSYLFLEITRRCNLNCRHCGSDCKHEAQSPELTTESWLKIVDYVARHFGKGVNFIITGGEPLLHPDIFRLGQHIAARQMRWGMVTNGMILNAERMKKLTDAGIYSITLSLDGMAQAHNWLRNSPKAYERVVKALEHIGQSPVSFKDVVTCVFPGNLNQLDSIAKLLLEKGISSWRLFRIFPSGRAAQNPELLLSFEQTWEMIRWIEQNKTQYAHKGLNINLSCEGFLPFDVDKQVRDAPFFCRAGVNIASILCDGNITGCSNNHPDFYEGNILKDEFRTLWDYGFENFRTRPWVLKTRCKDCQHLGSCQGGSIHLWNLHTDHPAFCYLEEKL